MFTVLNITFLEYGVDQLALTISQSILGLSDLKHKHLLLLTSLGVAGDWLIWPWFSKVALLQVIDASGWT